MAVRLLTGLTAQQIGTSAQCYSNKRPLDTKHEKIIVTKSDSFKKCVVINFSGFF